MTRLSSIRRAAALGIAAGAVAVFGIVAPASAAPSSSSETWFFSGPDFAVQVGTRYVNCSLPFIETYGTVTAYRTVVWSARCD